MRNSTLYRAVFALVAASALGFGATQALASSAEARTAACNPRRCNLDCIATGASGGSCLGQDCACYIF